MRLRRRDAAAALDVGDGGFFVSVAAVDADGCAVQPGSLQVTATRSL